MREFQKGQRVYQLVTYGAGLSKRHFGVVRKLGARGARVRFESGDELWVSRGLYPDNNTNNNTNNNGDDTEGTTMGKGASKTTETLVAGTRVAFRWQNKDCTGTVRTANDRMVQVQLDGGGIAWPRLEQVSLLVPPAAGTVAPNLTLVPQPQTPAAPVVASTNTTSAVVGAVRAASAANGAAPVVQAKGTTATPTATPTAAPTAAPSGDWVKELADHAARLLGTADASVQEAQARSARARATMEKATRGLEEARRLLAESEAEVRRSEADAAEVMEKRDALLRIVRGGKATS